VVIDGGFVCGDHRTAWFKILKGGRKESNREQKLAFRTALSFCSKMRAGMVGEAAVRAKEGRRRSRPIRRCLCAEG